jgi:hypothetical protein
MSPERECRFSDFVPPVLEGKGARGLGHWLPNSDSPSFPGSLERKGKSEKSPRRSNPKPLPSKGSSKGKGLSEGEHRQSLKGGENYRRKM